MAFRNRRGQVSAPIELFVAVIIMSFSMALALFIYNQSADTQCEYRVRSQNERLQEAFQEVAISSWGTTKTVDYLMERCGTRPVDAVRFVHYPSARYCGECPGSFKGCWKIEPLTYDPSTGTLATISKAAVCVNLAELLTINGVTDAIACPVAVTQTACPASVRGNVISPNDCFKKSLEGMPQADYNAAYWASFSRPVGGNDYFRIRITKGETAGGAFGAAGELLVCASQVR
jgi:type II secretory pathway pseudopilin PulG